MSPGEPWIGQQYRACEGWSMKRRDQISVSQPLEACVLGASEPSELEWGFGSCIP